MPRHAVRYILSLLLFLLLTPAHAGVVINGTRIIYPANEREITVQVTNDGKKPVLIQSWLDIGDKNSAPDTIKTPFILTPPINRLDAGKAQSLRIISTTTSALPQDRESLFWLNVLEIPSRPKGEMTGENYLQFAIRSRLKFFWRPEALKKTAAMAPHSLTWKLSAQGMTIGNPSPHYISLYRVSIDGKKVNVDMLPPFGNLTVDDIKMAHGKTVKAEWIDDYGAIRKKDFTVD